MNQDYITASELHNKHVVTDAFSSCGAGQGAYELVMQKLQSHNGTSWPVWVGNYVTVQALEVPISSGVEEFSVFAAQQLVEALQDRGFYAEFRPPVSADSLGTVLVSWDPRIIAERFGMELTANGDVMDPCLICPAYVNSDKKCAGCSKRRMYRAYFGMS